MLIRVARDALLSRAPPRITTAALEQQSEDSQSSSQSSRSTMLTPMLFLDQHNPPLAALHSMTEMKTSPNGGNPHGIDHILARPAGLSYRPFNSVAGVAAAAASYFQQNGAKPHGLVDFSTRSPIYWPGLQGLVNNPMAWRDRLASCEYPLPVF